MTEILRPSWDQYFLTIAETVSLRGECTRAKVGAVIVKDNRIVATGYNGAPAGHPNCLEGACPRASSGSVPGSAYDNCIAIHAEANALLYADRDKCEGSSMYITRAPCDWCRKLIQGSGITGVYWPTESGELHTEAEPLRYPAGYLPPVTE